jgi:hypothetical protein
MSKLTISVQNHEPTTRVRDMRRDLARVLSKLKGDRKVTFSFHASLGDSDAKS